MPVSAVAARRGAPGSAFVVLVAALLVLLLSACGPNQPSEQATKTALVKDPSLTPLLVSDADFAGRNWTVTDMTDQAIEAAGKQQDAGKTTPAECDGSKMTSMAGGAVASIAANGMPQTMAVLSRDESSEDPAEVIKRWVQTCGTFKVEMAKGKATAHTEAVQPPDAGVDNQAGYRYTVTVDSMNGVPASSFGGGDVSFVGYTTRIGDVTVMAMSMGGQGWGGKDMAPDVEVLDAVYLAQVDKVKGS